MENLNEKHKLYENMVNEMKEDFFNFLNCEEKFNLYNITYNYFQNYMFMYMKENYNIDSYEYIDNWILSKNWLVVNYYDEDSDSDVELCLDTEQFFEFIKSKE